MPTLTLRNIILEGANLVYGDKQDDCRQNHRNRVRRMAEFDTQEEMWKTQERAESMPFVHVVFDRKGNTYIGSTERPGPARFKDHRASHARGKLLYGSSKIFFLVLRTSKCAKDVRSLEKLTIRRHRPTENAVWNDADEDYSAPDAEVVAKPPGRQRQSKWKRVLTQLPGDGVEVLSNEQILGVRDKAAKGATAAKDIIPRRIPGAERGQATQHLQPTELRAASQIPWDPRHEVRSDSWRCRLNNVIISAVVANFTCLNFFFIKRGLTFVPEPRCRWW